MSNELDVQNELEENTHTVVTKASSKIILVQVYIIFALPDYSSEVIERHQLYPSP